MEWRPGRPVPTSAVPQTESSPLPSVQVIFLSVCAHIWRRFQGLPWSQAVSLGFSFLFYGMTGTQVWDRGPGNAVRGKCLPPSLQGTPKVMASWGSEVRTSVPHGVLRHIQNY